MGGAHYAELVSGIAGDADRRLVNLLGALSLGLADAVTEATEAVCGLTDAAPAALVSMAESPPGRSIDDLRRLVGLTHSGAVRLVDRLVDAGYVERRTGRTGRFVSLALTRRGAAMARKVRLAREHAVAGVILSLDEQDRADLSRIADTLVTTVTRQRLARRDQGEEPAGGALCRLCDFRACGRPETACPAAGTAIEHRAPSRSGAYAEN